MTEFTPARFVKIAADVRAAVKLLDHPDSHREPWPAASLRVFARDVEALRQHVEGRLRLHQTPRRP